MCGQCLKEGFDPRDGAFAFVCRAPKPPPRQVELTVADGTVLRTKLEVLRSQSSLVREAAGFSGPSGWAAVRVPLPTVPAAAVATAIEFCQRVHNVDARAKSVAIAWKKAFLPQLLEDFAALASLTHAARTLDAVPLRRLACAAVAEQLRRALVEGTIGSWLAHSSADDCGDDANAFNLCQALGGVEALAECLAAGDTETESDEALWQAAEAVDDHDWREALALVHRIRISKKVLSEEASTNCMNCDAT
jgi:hypothetical protein